MRKSLLIFCLIVFSQFGISQEFIWDQATYKPGVYKTYGEFITNAPTLELSQFDIQDKKASHGLMGLEGHPVKRFKLKRKEAEKIGGIIGFSDGTHVYINPAAMKEFDSKTNFYEVEFYGQFCYLEFLQKSTVRNGSHTSSSYNKTHGFFNLANGKFMELNRYTMHDLLEATDPELLEKFEKEKGKNKKVKDYFIEFVERREARETSEK
ncbi:hypothetical protein [Zhouia amylolytica]|uniref:Uncharacterized protein n=1 Tax=Zhouia amylolytica AD3 TaxID=1286632 RepID=W2UQN0_9FLAO|nr:hypothetical protein [Zhouia amylolytica]ETN95771.1 hypothetical protein P278_14930 [Zhouia amylolytica AD3]